MPKQNYAILLNKYIWLIDTIYSAGHIPEPSTFNIKPKEEITEMHKLYK